MKALVETAGDFSLYFMDAENNVAQKTRPSLVPVNAFYNQRLGLGHLKVLRAELPDDAKDAAFAKHLEDSEGDWELALDSYLSTLESPEAPEGQAQEPVNAEQLAEREAAARVAVEAEAKAKAEAEAKKD